MLTTNASESGSCFEEELKRGSIAIPTYLGRLVLRTHDKGDTEILASLFSNPVARKYLVFLQPPNGWGDDEERKPSQQWTKEDFRDRVNVQKETRANGKSCVLNIILLASASGERTNRCIGTTGYVTVDGNVGYLGIITDPETTRRGYATEALYTSVALAFERLGVNQIRMQTDERNEEMRGWCEHIAGLQVKDNQEKNINGIRFLQCEYSFTLEEWTHSIQRRLEEKMNRIPNLQA